jgi:acetyl-CoA carboxylase biotin carboxyl carrier protein
MNLEFIQHLIGIHERSGLSELEYVDGAQRLRLTRNPTGQPVQAPPLQPDAPDAERSARLAPTPAPTLPIAQPAPVARKAGRREVTAGTAGTFHAQPAPHEPPWVGVGTEVSDGQTLGLIEAMKMLNAIESPVAGTVREVVAADGAAVEAGDVLFILDTTVHDV